MGNDDDLYYEFNPVSSMKKELKLANKELIALFKYVNIEEVVHKCNELRGEIK